MRLIDADALYKDICDSINAMTRIGITVDGDYLWAKINDALENASTIEPKRKMGKWITQEFGSWAECSECHELYDIPIAYSNFCPNCGADMRGERNED